MYPIFLSRTKIPVISSSRAFKRGDKPGLGAPPRPPRKGPIIIYQTRNVGQGTLEDPRIHWLREPPADMPARDRVEAIARKEAIHMGFPCVIIRMATHSTTFALTSTVNRLEQRARYYSFGGSPMVRRHNPHTPGTTRNGVPTVKIDIDPHLTVYLGQDWNHCQVDGHTFLLVDDRNLPVRKIREAERRLIEPGREAVAAEYWHYP